MYQTIRIGPMDRGQSLAEEFWCWEPRTQTDLLFQCPDGFIRSHKLLLRGYSRTIARAMAGKTFSRGSDFTLILVFDFMCMIVFIKAKIILYLSH